MTNIDVTVGILASQLERVRQDMNEIAAKARDDKEDSDKETEALRNDVNDLRSEVLKYKWLMSGIVACLSAFAAALNYIGFDYFEK